MWLRRLWKGCRQYTRNVPGERHFYVARYAVMCHPPDFALIGRLPSNAADAECLNPLDFLSATMKPGRNGMSLDWTQRDLREGLRCFHSGAFFEAHEHWESVWLAAQEPEKTFLQGLIQVAASFHHFQRGNLAGTVSLLRSALCRLDAYPEAFAGVAVARFERRSACGSRPSERRHAPPCRPFRSSKSSAQGQFPRTQPPVSCRGRDDHR